MVWMWKNDQKLYRIYSLFIFYVIYLHTLEQHLHQLLNLNNFYRYCSKHLGTALISWSGSVHSSMLWVYYVYIANIHSGRNNAPWLHLQNAFHQQTCSMNFLFKCSKVAWLLQIYHSSSTSSYLSNENGQIQTYLLQQSIHYDYLCLVPKTFVF